MKQLPTTKSPRQEMSRVRGRPGKSTRSNKANEPNAPKRLICELEKSRWVRPKTDGITTAARTDRSTAKSPGSFALTHPAALDHERSCACVCGVAALVIGSRASRSGAGPVGKSQTYPR
jgi:hypothetical protein